MRRLSLGVLAAFFLFSFAKASAYELTPRLSLSLSEEYNDNILLSKNDKKSDFVTHVSPGIDLSARFPKVELGLGYFPSFNLYASHSDRNNTSHRFNARGSVLLSERLSLSVEDSFIKSEEAADLREIPDQGPVRERRQLTANTVSTRLVYKMTPRIAPNVGLSYATYDYSGGGTGDDNTSYTGTLSVPYILSERTTLSANIRYTLYDYKERSDADTQEYTLGFLYKLTPTITANLSAGIAITELDSTGKKDEGFSGGIELTKKTERGSVSLAFRQTVTAGISEGTPQRTQSYTFRVTRQLAPLWNASASVGYSRFKSIGDLSRKSDEYRGSAAIWYKINQWANAGLSYSYIKLDDKLYDASGYNNHIVMFTLRFNYNPGPLF